MKRIFFLLVIFFPPIISNAKTHDIYQIKIYHLKNSAQIAAVDDYLQKAYLPALHKMGLQNIGVFKPIANDTAAMKFIYVIIPFSSLEQWRKLDEALNNDVAYTTTAKKFIEASADNAPYERMESILLDAFPWQEHLVVPPSKDADRVFELRSYESPTLHLAGKKMAMFNKGGEIQIFNRLKFNPVFYAKVISGSHMPNFMYMPVFNDPVNENKVSVSHIDSILMHSTSYSDY
jgi:hypothetical protein